MAENICRHRINEILIKEGIASSNIEVFSAGIKPTEGLPLSNGAKTALEELNIMSLDHESRRLNNAMVRKANVIFCMSEAHKEEVKRLFPAATLKVVCMDPENNLPIPHGQDVNTYRTCAKRLDSLITNALDSQLIKLA